jgi:hypothetical protein
MCSISKHTFSRSSHRTIGINLQLCADDFRRSLQKDVDKIKDGYQGYQDYLLLFQAKKTENERLKNLIVSELSGGLFTRRNREKTTTVNVKRWDYA